MPIREREREKERRTNKTRHYPGFSRDALPSERKSFRSDFLFDGFSSSSSRSRFATAIDSLDVRRGKRGKEKKERTNKSVGEGGRRRRENAMSALVTIAAKSGSTATTCVQRRQSIFIHRWEGERGRVTKGRSLSRRCYVCSHPRFIGNTWTRSKDRVFLCLLFLSGFRPFISPTSDRGNWRGGGGFAIHVSNDRCEILLFFAVWNGILLRQFDRIDGKVLFGVTFKINLDFSFF